MKSLVSILLAIVLPLLFLSAEEKTDPKALEILDFWFGPIKNPEDFPKDRIILWFGKKDNIDRDIRNKYEYLVQAASKHELDSWKKTPRGRLALILLVDQFPRNIYRDTPQAFAYDAQALELAQEGLKNGEDAALLPIEKAFFYFPLMHTENLQIQEQSVKKYKELVLTVPSSLHSNFNSYLAFALRHYDVICTFGRYPHRNKILGRESTQAELDFLETPGSSF